MNKVGVITSTLVAATIAYNAVNPVKSSYTPEITDTPSLPNSQPTATPEIHPTIEFNSKQTQVPTLNLEVQPNNLEVLSVNAQYVTIPSLGINRMYVNGYSSAPSYTPNLFTQFSLACRGFSYDEKQNIYVPYNIAPSCIALQAHNYLYPGTSIEGGMIKGDHVFIQNDANQVLEFEVVNILRYKATPPLGVDQVFVNLENGVSLTSEELMKHIYNVDGQTSLGVGENYLVIQTCIREDTNGNEIPDSGDNWVWGREFIIGRLVDVLE